MVDQVLCCLNCLSGRFYCDGTVGLGGHAERILDSTSPDGKLLGIDMDSNALAIAGQRLVKFRDRVTLVHGNYKDLPSIMESHKITALDGVLLDLGVSSYQLGDQERGFSFQSDEPLGMNFDPSGGIRASDIVNRYPEAKLAEIIWNYGGERWARRIARRIAEERKRNPIETTTHLVRTIRAAVPRSPGRWRIHPATRTFQALRIEVNQELENLARFLRVVCDCLKQGARVCIISFHSLEDGLVKRFFREAAGKGTGGDVHRRIDMITKKPLRPSPEEVHMNPRSRSARMRVAECR
ncbi:MAG: 16S rRNA (cytosine(1402)-N(4))-methyltransferase RsmH [bacterium]